MPFTSRTFDVLRKNVLYTMEEQDLQPEKTEPTSPITPGKFLNVLYATVVGNHDTLDGNLDERDLDDFSDLLTSFRNHDARITKLSLRHLRINDLERISYRIQVSQVDKSRSGNFIGYSDGPTRIVHREGVPYSKILSDINQLLATSQKISEEAIKKFVTATKNQTIYVYRTQTMIDVHYRVMAQVLNLTSCMSHPSSHYGRSGKAEVANKVLAYPKHEDVENYYHPTSAYEKIDDLYLGLATKKHHSEWVDGEYPFVARSIVHDSCGLKYVQWYGEESITRQLRESMDYDCLSGYVLREITCSEGKVVVPYIDGCSQKINRDLEILEGAPNMQHNTGVLNLGVNVPTRGGEYDADEVTYCDYRDEHLHNDDVVGLENGEAGYDGDIDHVVFRCVECGEYAHVDDMTELENGSYILDAYRNDVYFKCHETEEWYHRDDMFVTGDGWHVRDEEQDSTYHFCEDNNEWYHVDDMIQTEDGAWFHNESDQCAVCAHDGKYYKIEDITEFDEDCVATENVESYLEERGEENVCES